METTEVVDGGARKNVPRKKCPDGSRRDTRKQYKNEHRCRSDSSPRRSYPRKKGKHLKFGSPYKSPEKPKNTHVFYGSPYKSPEKPKPVANTHLIFNSPERQSPRKESPRRNTHLFFNTPDKSPGRRDAQTSPIRSPPRSPQRSPRPLSPHSPTEQRSFGRLSPYRSPTPTRTSPSRLSSPPSPERAPSPSPRRPTPQKSPSKLLVTESELDKMSLNKVKALYADAKFDREEQLVKYLAAYITSRSSRDSVARSRPRRSPKPIDRLTFGGGEGDDIFD
jgi:hypothetical protein